MLCLDKVTGKLPPRGENRVERGNLERPGRVLGFLAFLVIIIGIDTYRLALIDDGKPVMGVVYAPAKNQLYYASKDCGAFKQSGNQAAQAIQARKLDLADITIAGSRSHSDARMQAFLANLAGNLSQPKLISIGSSLKICLVAEGAADVYPRLGLTSEWDTAAAQCVLEQAGGRLTNISGVPFCYNAKESLLNPEFFACGMTPHDWKQYLE